MAAPTYTTRTSFSISQFVANPFDTIGAAGPEHVLTITNDKLHIHNKEGTLVDDPTLGTLFNVAGSPFDPRIVYDAVEDRFYAIAALGRASGSPSGSFLVIAISKTSTPTTGGSSDWHKLSEQVSQGENHWLDFPMIGYNADVVVVSGKLFPKDGKPVHSHFFAYVIPKSDLTDPSPTLANLEAVNIAAPLEFSHPIVDRDDGSLPLSLWRWDPTTSIDRLDVTQNGSYAVAEVASIAYTDAIGADGSQSGVAVLDHSADDRISTYPVKIGGFIYLVLPGRARPEVDSTIVVFKINESTNTVTAQATITEVGLDLIYPSIAVNSSGNIVIGCTATGGNVGQFPGVMIFVGQDDGATMSFSAGDLIKAGERVYEKDVSGRNRWGDYSAAVVDPTDEKRFWIFQTWAFNNESNDEGRKIEVAEVIVDPAGFRDLFALTMGWKSSVPLVAAADDAFRVFAESSGVPTVVAQSTATPTVFAQSQSSPDTFSAS